ncbi:MAG: carbohydrate ABC transporter permease [Sphaerochaetaceae bacterium]|jgi:multiple sugar transport system permease protein
MQIKKGSFVPYLLVTPALIMLCMFIVYPMVMNVITSFQSYSLVQMGRPWVGLSNYKTLITDSRVWSAIQRTFIWTGVNLACALALGLGSALLLNTGFKGNNIIKALILIPWILPSVITGYIWSLMLSEDAGIITWILKTLGWVSRDFSWFRTGPLAMASAMMANIWRAFPFFSLMIYAKLNTVPGDQIEAALLEGVNRRQMFRYVTFPFIKPVVTSCTYLCFIWTFNAYDILKIMTNGGPAELTTTMSIMVQREAFSYYSLSNAATLSVIMFVLMVSIIVLAKLGVRMYKRITV